MRSFFSTETITTPKAFLSISTALLHIFVLLMAVVARFNLLFLVIIVFKDSSLEITRFLRISLDYFSPSSRAFRKSSITSGDAVTPD